MNLVEFCKHVEGRLGWEPPQGDVEEPDFRRYGAEAAKVKRKIATDPDRFTWRNLKLAVEYCRRQHLTRTPVGVFAYVDAAVEKATVPVDDVEAALQQAMRQENAKGDPEGWAARMMRASGRYRAEVLEEWRAR